MSTDINDVCCVYVFGVAIWKAWNEDGSGVEAPSEAHAESAGIGRFSGVDKQIQTIDQPGTE